MIYWILLLIVKSAIYGPFIIGGPVAIICAFFGWDFAGTANSETATMGAWICTFLNFFIIPDYILTWSLPWVRGVLQGAGVVVFTAL